MKDQVRASGIEVDFTGREGDDLKKVLPKR